MARHSFLSGISVAHEHEIRRREQFMQMSDTSELRAALEAKGRSTVRASVNR